MLIKTSQNLIAGNINNRQTDITVKTSIHLQFSEHVVQASELIF